MCAEDFGTMAHHGPSRSENGTGEVDTGMVNAINKGWQGFAGEFS